MGDDLNRRRAEASSGLADPEWDRSDRGAARDDDHGKGHQRERQAADDRSRSRHAEQAEKDSEAEQGRRRSMERLRGC